LEIVTFKNLRKIILVWKPPKSAKHKSFVVGTNET